MYIHDIHKIRGYKEHTMGENRDMEADSGDPTIKQENSNMEADNECSSMKGELKVKILQKKLSRKIITLTQYVN